MVEAVIATGAVISALAATYNASAQDTAQRKSLKTQKTTQQQAQNAALRTEQQTEQQLMKANQKQPDITELLNGVAKQKPKGTLLSGDAGGTSLLGL